MGRAHHRWSGSARYLRGVGPAEGAPYGRVIGFHAAQVHRMTDLTKKARRLLYTAAPLIAFVLTLSATKRWH